MSVIYLCCSIAENKFIMPSYSQYFFFLQGIGSFTIVDGNRVSGEDVGNK